MLYQIINGKKKYVAFTSKSLRKGQKNYPAVKRELLAILFALKKWEEILVIEDSLYRAVALEGVREALRENHPTDPAVHRLVDSVAR